MQNNLQVIDLQYKMFNNFSLMLIDDKMYSIIGSNMCGKTTLFNIMIGIIPTSNVVSCCNILLNNNTVNDYIKLLGVVPNYNDNLFIFETVFEEMYYPLKNLGYCKKYILKRINDLTTLFSINYDNKKISDLTILERQILLIIIALLHKPKVLIIDNLLSNMDIENANRIITILKSIENLMIINFSNSLLNAKGSDYIYIMDNFKIKGEGTYQDIVKKYNLLRHSNIEVLYINKISDKLLKEGLINKECDNINDLVNEIWK